MMSTVAPKPPAAPRPTPPAALVDSEGFIDEHIGRTRRALKLVDLSAGLLSLAVAVLGYLLAAAMLDQWVVPGGLGTTGRMVLFGVLLAIVVWQVVRHFLPLLRPINPVYAAHTIEQNAPSLKNSLLNALLFRTHRQEMSAKVFHALEQQAAMRLSSSSADASIDHSALLRLGYALLAVIAVCALYSVLSPKNLAVSAARILSPWSDLAAPTRVKILDVLPGDTAVARGERLTVSAAIVGARDDEPARLRYSTADEQTVGEAIIMTRPGGGSRVEAQLPRAADAGGAVGVMQNLEYWIEAGDARTRPYKVSVFDRPTLVVERVRYEFPAYTGMLSTEVAGTGDLRGVEGTRVTVRAIASQPIKTAAIDFDADGTSDLPMSVEGAKSDRAVASFVLALRDDRRTPVHPNYVLRLETKAGRKNADPAQYRIEVTPDYAPEVQITQPEEPETTVRADQAALIGAEARDPDYALAQLRLVGKVGDREVLIGDLMPDGKPQTGRVGGMKPFTPADAQLKPGDVLEFWAEATDNRRPQPNVAVSDRRRLKIAGPREGEPGAAGERGDNRPQDQPQQQPGDGAEGGQQAGGQNQGGDPQAGEQGGEGEPGQQGAAGGEGEGQQSDQPQAGQSAPGGAGESGGDNGGDDAKQNPDGGGQGGDPSQGSQDPAAEPNDPGAQQQPSAAGGRESDPSAQQPQGGAPSAPSRVSPDGDADGDAVQRMQEHFAQQDANNQQGGADQQSGQTAAADGGAADQNAAQQDNGQQSGDQPPAAGDAQPQPNDSSGAPNPDGARNSQSKPSAGQSDQPQPSGAGEAQPQPGAQDPGQRRAADESQQGKTGDGNPGQERDGERPTPDSVGNQNQGDAGSGSATKEDSGAPGDQDSGQRSRDKQDADNRRAQGDQEAPSQSPDKRDSDSRGSTSGDRAGGGQEGSGQHADAQGKGSAGQHEAADQGAGKAAEQGDGETGDQAGDQQLADGKTGQSSGDKPGPGSQSRQSEDASESGADQKSASGDRAADQGAEQSPGGESGDQSSNDPENNAGEQAGDQPGVQPGEQPGNDQGDEASGQSGEHSSKQGGQQSGQGAKADAASKASPSEGANPEAPGGASSQPQGGGTSSGSSPLDADAPAAEEIADKANLDYARQQTDLLLERLDEQLAKQKVDPKLLKSLGWTEDELRRFVQRWAGLKSRADAQDPDAQRQLDAALRSLGLRRGEPLRFRAGATADKVRDLNDAYRARAPLEYSDRVRAYLKGAAGGEGEK